MPALWRISRGQTLGACCGLAIALLACGGSSPQESAAERKRTVLESEFDDERVGNEGSYQVEAEVGILADPELVDYVDRVARKLLPYAPRRSFEYSFAIVDQFEPNAFALPGGRIYVSRGLLALANSEDELANVLGHEIIHSAERHAAARQAVAIRQNPFAMPYLRIAQLAAYGRQQETDADRGGQEIAARAGFDPQGMTSFLSKLENAERLEMGHSRIPRFFDTHPGTVMRTADCAARARELQWERGADFVDEHLDRIEGIELGTRPAEGIFEGSLFMHPDLGFQIRFPDGWELSNTPQSVGAVSPAGRAFVFLSLDGPAREAREAAEVFVTRHAVSMRLHILKTSAVQVGEIPSWRIEARGLMEGRAVLGVLTFVPLGEFMYRITAIATTGALEGYFGRARGVARSFAPLSDEARAGIERRRLHVVEARAGEGFESLGRRVDNALDPLRTALLNGYFVDQRFTGGERIKVARSEPYSSLPD